MVLGASFISQKDNRTRILQLLQENLTQHIPAPRPGIRKFIPDPDPGFFGEIFFYNTGILKILVLPNFCK
jgi:hypothetical protein